MPDLFSDSNMFITISYCYFGMFFSYWLEEKDSGMSFLSMPFAYKLGVFAFIPMYLLKHSLSWVGKKIVNEASCCEESGCNSCR